MYRLREIEKRHNAFRLSITDDCFEHGNIYAITGPNGCGKTTLLDLLALTTVPTSGNMIFDRNMVDYKSSMELTQLRSRIGYLMQDPYLFNMNVHDNIIYGLRLRGRSQLHAKALSDNIIDQLGLQPLLKRRPRSLSGGEAQRVALARTLALDTDVLLLDEPTANVDSSYVYTIEALLTEMNRRYEKTIIFTTHSREQAYRLSKNIVTVINGTVSDIAYENVFSGRVHTGSDGLGALAITDNVQVQLGKAISGHATIAIDPNDVILSSKPFESSALNRVRGRIVKAEEADTSLRVFVDVGVPICALITRGSFDRMKLGIGTEVWATWKANAVKVL